MDKSENVALMIRDGRFDDELSLLDLVAFVRRNIRILLGGSLIGGALGLGIAFSLHAQWEAIALIRIGQLGNVGNVGNVGSPVEPPLQLVDRIKNKSFQKEVLKRLRMSVDDHNVDVKCFHDSLKVKLEKSELINLKLEAGSADEAKLKMNAVVNELKEIHKKMSSPTITRLQQELVTIDLELSHASVESERLRKSLEASNSQNEITFSQAALVSNLLLAREGELRGLRDRKRVLEEQLSPERTFSTDIFGRVEVSTEPVFPKKLLFAAAGLLLGLILSVLLTLRHVSLRKPVLNKSD